MSWAITDFPAPIRAKQSFSKQRTLGEFRLSWGGKQISATGGLVVATEVVRSDPASGKIIIASLADPRLPAGTVKLSQIVYWTEGSAEIHYLFHAAYGYFDFKFK